MINKIKRIICWWRGGHIWELSGVCTTSINTEPWEVKTSCTEYTSCKVCGLDDDTKTKSYNI